MWDRFGEFDSVEELNCAAQAQKDEGDETALTLLAKENGIDAEDAEDFMDGYVEELANWRTAAVGKLSAEAEDLKLSGLLMDWVQELQELCVKDKNFAIAVRRKGKELAEFIARTADDGYKNRATVDARITARTKEVKKIVGDHEFAIGIPSRTRRAEIARKYYMQEEEL